MDHDIMGYEDRYYAESCSWWLQDVTYPHPLCSLRMYHCLRSKPMMTHSIDWSKRQGGVILTRKLARCCCCCTSTKLCVCVHVMFVNVKHNAMIWGETNLTYIELIMIAIWTKEGSKEGWGMVRNHQAFTDPSNTKTAVPSCVTVVSLVYNCHVLISQVHVCS